MKTADLFEMALTAKSDLKERRLKALFTPENIAANYEKVIAALAYKLSVDDINELAADLSGKELDSDEAAFQLKLMLKKLPPEAKASIEPRADINAMTGIIPGAVSAHPMHSTTKEQATFWVEYAKGKWKVSFYSRKHYNSAEHKRFDESTDALQHLLNALKKAKP